MMSSRHLVRRWAGRRLRQLIEIGTRDVAADLRSRGTDVTAQLSELGTEVAAIRRDLDALAEQTGALRDQMRSVGQSLRYLSYSGISARAGPPQPDLTSYEMRVFSQNGEDGVLFEILRRIGSQAKRFVEVGAQAAESNCIALAVLLGWEGTVVEADPERAEEFRRSHSVHGRVVISESFITRENVNDVVAANPLDVFSLDIDGNDYWVWQALDVVTPRVVIVEYNAKLDPDRSLVQPYDPLWVWQKDDAFGASRSAMVQLGAAKGYQLVHAETSGANLFFVRDDLMADHFLSAHEVIVRTPNYYLTASSHPDASRRLAYIDLDERPGASP